jgi:hypothetical protein
MIRLAGYCFIRLTEFSILKIAVRTTKMCWTKHQIRAAELTLGAPVILDDAKKRTALLPLLFVFPLAGHYKAPPQKKGT